MMYLTDDEREIVGRMTKAVYMTTLAIQEAGDASLLPGVTHVGSFLANQERLVVAIFQATLEELCMEHTDE
jgi:hypothetical protein